MASAPPTMIGLSLPDVDVWSGRVAVALGKNPGVFTGPGTNTYLVGTGRERILVDTGDGRPDYLPVLERALAEVGCRIQEILLTHGHPDHIGGCAGVVHRFGAVPVSKRPWQGNDESYRLDVTPIDDGAVIRTEGATLRAIHTPGHAEDHLCFLLEEERALFSGDNVLGVGTTVIPGRGGSLLAYMDSLRRLLGESPSVIYPAHGPRIDDGEAKLREYIAHREERERQIQGALRGGPLRIPEIVKVVYAAYPESLYAAAGQSVCSHLIKLEDEGAAERVDGGEPIAALWALT